MKPVKNLVFAAILVFSLSFGTLAGEVDVPGAPVPPPRVAYVCDPNSSVNCTTTEEEPVMVLETSDSLFYEALVALLSVY